MKIKSKKNVFKMLSIVLNFLLIILSVSGADVRASAVDSSNTDLISMTINGQKINVEYPWVVNYNLSLPSNASGDYLSVVTEVYDKNSTVSIEGNKIINNSALVKVTVTAENKISSRVYYVNVEVKDVDSNGGFVDIKTADFHTLALKDDGTLYSFGENKFGQLGDDTKTMRTSPVQVKKLTNVTDFDTSNSHSIAVTSDGAVWVWGLNDFGQLGVNSNKDILIPTKVEGISGIVKVKAGNRFNLALDKYGHVWFWGYNAKEQFEDNDNINLLKPSILSGLSSTKIIDIAAGDYHSLALSDEGNVYTWGANDFGQLGNGTLYNNNIPDEVIDLEKIKFISANGNTSSVITEDGRAYYWGEIIFYEGGISEEGTVVTVPELIEGISEAQRIEVNNNHIVYMKINGEVYSKGVNKYGQLGDGTINNKDYFSWISRINLVNKISISEHSSFFLSEDGYIYVSGRNDIGQLGVNQIGGIFITPKKLESFSSIIVSNVYSNYKSGEVDKLTVVRLATDTFGSRIFYTIDGSNPSDKSTIYRTPIVINEYTVIKAIALKDGRYSAVSNFEYIISNKAKTEMNITIGSKESKVGEYVEIPITLSNVPAGGISNLKVALKFNPEILSLQNITHGELVKESSDFSYTKLSNDTILLSFYDSSRTNRNISKAGTLATIKFYVKYGVSAGRYSIEQVYNSEEGVYSKGVRVVNVYYNNGYVDAVNPNSIIYGDVDGDSKVTALDLQYVQRYISKKILYFPHYKGTETADVDKDGDIDSNDIELIKKIILKIQ
jgi:alpha-tubulin suppressor-like RCC1 family protein